MWDRTWFVDVTEQGQLNIEPTLTFDYSDAGLELTNETDFTLLQSTDGGVSWVSLSDNWILDGDTVTFPLGAGELVWLEINTQPGMTPTSLLPEQAEYAGHSWAELLSWIVEDASCGR